MVISLCFLLLQKINIIYDIQVLYYINILKPYKFTEALLVKNCCVLSLICVVLSVLLSQYYLFLTDAKSFERMYPVHVKRADIAAYWKSIKISGRVSSQKSKEYPKNSLPYISLCTKAHTPQNAAATAKLLNITLRTPECSFFARPNFARIIFQCIPRWTNASSSIQ